jgi:hypothetical protein
VSVDLDLLGEYLFSCRQIPQDEGVAGACGDGEDLRYARIELSGSMMETCL